MRDEDGSIYSEKRFSTGELALLHLADSLQNIENRLSSASGESAEITNNELIRIIVEHVPDSVVMQLLGRVIGH